MLFCYESYPSNIKAIFLLPIKPYSPHPILLLQTCTTYAATVKCNRHLAWAPGLISEKAYKEQQNLNPPEFFFLPVFNAKQRAQAGHHRKGTEQSNIKRSEETLHGDVN